MAPKHQRNPQGIVNTDKPVTTATEDKAITWTGRPLDEPTWYYITLHQQTYIEKLCSDFFSDGVPSTCQANKLPADHTLPLMVVEAMSSTTPSELSI